MADNRNFLLGRGERITEPIPPPGRVLDREPPYSLARARARVQPMLRDAIATFAALPATACPHNEAIASVLLHPEYVAKSYYPSAIIDRFGLRAVGSRPARVTPEARSKNRDPEEKATTELFVAGSRQNFQTLLAYLPAIEPDTPEAQALPALEQLAAIPPAAKVKPVLSDARRVPLEVVLHAAGTRQHAYIVSGFEAYLGELGLAADIEHRIHVGGLCFLRMEAPKAMIEQVAGYSFLRLVREMPRLRMMEPIVRGLPATVGKTSLPPDPPLDRKLRVAVFDGGFPTKSPLDPWVRRHEADALGKPVAAHVEHGYQVTSAVLFGHLQPGETAPRPYAFVDNYRVADDKSEHNIHLFDVIERIRGVLDSSPKYDFINLSVGPALPVEDNDVHVWTAVLDEYLADGVTVATVAVGNTGHLDAAAGLNRIQVPADCVNALCIGAADRHGKRWQRAPYSSIGPGRSPGLIKPDALAFGGSEDQPYHVLKPGGLLIAPNCGTSFAAPHALRAGIMVKAHFAGSLNALAVRALLVHTTDEAAHDQAEIGWGRITDDLEQLVVCPPGLVRVVYQGELTAGKYLRARLPLPDDGLKGKIELKATCCYASAVDSAHPGNYTRGGLEFFFRPHADAFADGAVNPKSKPLFSQSRLFATEDQLRRDAHKWETCLHSSRSMLAKSLKAPVLDIHYLARDEGRSDPDTNKIQYALIVSIKAKRHPDLYEQVVRKYRNILEPMTPIIQVPVRT